jgi:mRNA interferase RelE/StbE
LAYAVELSSAAERDVRDLPRQVQERVLSALAALAEAPRAAPNVKKLVGADGYRLRLGPYRVLYALDDLRQTITVFRVSHRREAYR